MNEFINNPTFSAVDLIPYHKAKNNLEKVSSPEPFRVLALDGGGMRGLYTASFLNTIANRLKKVSGDYDIGKGFDLIVGTSTGSILAAGLAAGISTNEIIKFYKEIGPTIFKKRIPHNRIFQYFWSLIHLYKPLNNNTTLKENLYQIFKNETLGQLYDRRQIGLCIPAINLITNNVNIFKTPHNKSKNADNNRRIIDVCMASSAAPIYFPIAEVDDGNNLNSSSFYVDGGLCANNPIMIALIEALNLSNETQSIEIISIGTCPPQIGEALIPGDCDKGLSYWKFGSKALEVSMAAQATHSHSSSELLVDYLISKGRQIYIHRVNQSVPSSSQEISLSLDNASEKSCNTLIQLGIKDALEVQRLAENGVNNSNKLIPIFESLPNLKIEE